ncbi:MAG: hypothetical protein ACTSU7_00330 [Candidatus Heimdallarchaeaceae archaeon]
MGFDPKSVGLLHNEDVVNEDNPLSVSTFNSLVTEAYDFIDCNYTAGLLSEVIYKTGGSGGTTVATITITYTGSDIDTVTKT